MGSMIAFKDFKEQLSESMMGINIRSDKKANISYADKIVDGEKTLESRETHSLKPYVGKRVAIVRTGEGKAKAIGEVTVGEPIIADEEEFRKRHKEHLVPAGSQFDIKKGQTKHLYPMLNPVRYDKEKDVGHGILARKVNE
jgi:predicted transcriptional regulator